MITVASDSLSQTDIRKQENMKDSPKDLKLVAALSQIGLHEDEEKTIEGPNTRSDVDLIEDQRKMMMDKSQIR